MWKKGHDVGREEKSRRRERRESWGTVRRERERERERQTDREMRKVQKTKIKK
jgi:hypothetical protein